jgi:CheY-like chemotaxis protein/HPt (histidine-containing phosphotransfer) domain-containing protein
VSRAELDRYALLGAFAQDARERIDTLEAWLSAVARGNEAELDALLPALEDAAHSLRGAAATGALDRIAALAAALEDGVRESAGPDETDRDGVTATVRTLLGALRGLTGSTLGVTEPDGETAPPIVLHVEDSLSNLKLVEQILLRRGDVTLVEARTGEAGAILAEDLLPALVLLDLRLPDTTGEEVLRRLRGRPATAELRVVMISAEARPAETQRLLDAGAHAFLVKPFDIAALDRLVDDALC